MSAVFDIKKGQPNQLANLVGGLQDRAQHANKSTPGESAGGTNMPEKRKLKKLTTEQIVRASDMSPHQQAPQQQLKVLHALAKQQPHHAHQKSH